MPPKMSRMKRVEKQHKKIVAVRERVKEEYPSIEETIEHLIEYNEKQLLEEIEEKEKIDNVLR